MNLRSRLALLLLLCLCTTCIFIACRKDHSDKEQDLSKTTFTVKEARSHFYKEVRPAMALRQQTSTRKPGKLYPLWDKAKTFNAGDYQIVEVPAYYEKRQLLTMRTALSNDPAAKTAEPTKAELGNFDRLVFYKYKDGTIEERIVTYIPDAGYMANHQYDASHNYLWALDKDFSGYLVHRTLELKSLNAFKVKNAKIISRLDYGKAARLNRENARWVEKCKTETVLIGFIYDCIIVVVDDPGQGYIVYENCKSIPIIEIITTCEDVWEEDPVDCWQTPHAPGCPNAGGGGGGGGTPCGGEGNPCPSIGPPAPAIILVYPAPDEVLDLSVYLGDAFNFSQPAKMILCTRQPVPGTRTPIDGYDLGQTFVTFEQVRNGNLVRRTVGFFPETGVSLGSPVSPMRFGNLQMYGYNVKLEANISSAQFQEAYNMLYYAGTGDFHLKSLNSHYLGYQLANLGFGITQNMGTLIPGATPDMWTAGDFGEDLKTVGGVAGNGQAPANTN
jgi:hypothetical protein